MTTPTRSFAALLFDMDGLMIDTEALSERVWRQTATEQGIPLSHEQLQMMVGLSTERCLQYLADTLPEGHDVRAFGQLARQRYHQMLHQEEIPLKPGILNLLDWCTQKNLPRAVATATQRTLADLKLARTGLQRYFAHTVAGDEVAHSKPAPDVYLKAAQLLGVHPADCIVLEDSVHGAQAALAANMRVIVVPDMAAPTPLIAKQALAVCQDLFAAQALLATLA
jgi:HAD superfamily hydrolase (TIGR01509 family)